MDFINNATRKQALGVRTAKGQSPLPMSTKEIMLPQLGEMSCPTRLALP
eukprot:COSAG04_NODE_483_length_13588_cov_21.765068_11_plen_49_part_00